MGDAFRDPLHEKKKNSRRYLVPSLTKTHSNPRMAPGYSMGPNYKPNTKKRSINSPPVQQI